MRRVSRSGRRRALALAAGAGAALLLGGCDRLGIGAGKPAFQGIDITGANYASALSLPDAQGRVRTLSEFKGKVVVVFFGFTQCPDVCPTTMIELAEVKQRLGADGARVQGVFVTIDPERDGSSSSACKAAPRTRTPSTINPASGSTTANPASAAAKAPN